MNFTTSNKIISLDDLWRFFNLSSSLLCIAGTDGYLKYINPSFTRLLGYTEDELLSRQFAAFVHPDDQRLTREKIKTLKQGRTAYFINRCQTILGDTRWFNWSLSYTNKYGLIYATGHDCSDKHEIEVQLVREKINKQKSIVGAVLHGQEMEKNEIGRELHDNVNQMLTTVKLYHEMAISNKEINTELIKKGTVILGEVIEEIRRLSKSLVAPDLSNSCLTNSVNDLIQVVMESGRIQIKFCNEYNPGELSGKIRLTLFRIIQEQLNNIIKHANAQTVLIEIRKDSKNIKLNIQDNGSGFDSMKKKKGIGLNNIISRAELHNGKVIIDSGLGKGCSLLVEIPLDS